MQSKQTVMWGLSIAELFKKLGTSRNGLSKVQITKLQKIYGKNEVPKRNSKNALTILVGQFTNPLIVVLLLATVVAFFLGEETDALIILGIVVVNAVLGFVQEYRAHKISKELEKLLPVHVGVIRNGKKVTVNATDLVPGDVVMLKLGDIVPADIRLIEAENISVDQASLTGESKAISKTSLLPKTAKGSAQTPSQNKTVVLMGSHVVSGSALGVVVVTGKDTLFGTTAAFSQSERSVSDFEKDMSSFSSFLLRLVFIMTAFIFVANTVLGKGAFNSFLFALALAVGITPESLPIIITISLSKGAQILGRRSVVVKKLTAVEDLGNMDLLCTDKTGTLTNGELSLDDIVVLDQDLVPHHNDAFVLGFLCTDVVAQGDKIEGSIIDRAFWLSKKRKLYANEIACWKVLGSNQFDFQRRRMSAVVENKDGDQYLVVKGGVESVVSVCSKVKKGWEAKIDHYRKQGYTTLALAIKRLSSKTKSRATIKTTVEDEKDLTLVGFFVFMDPPRDDAKEAIARMHSLGVSL